MKELEVVLAITLSMLLFSTLASMIVEIFWRLLQLRSRQLKKMVEQVYSEEIYQRVLGNTAEPTKAQKEAFSKQYFHLDRYRKSISAFEFVRQLAGMEEAKAIAVRSHDKLHLVIDELADRFDDFGNAARENFRRYSYIVNLVVSILLAFTLKVNIVILASSFYANSSLTQNVISQSDKIIASYEMQATRLQEASENDAFDQNAVDDLTQSIDRFEETLAVSKNMNLPIGFSFDGLPEFNRLLKAEKEDDEGKIRPADLKVTFLFYLTTLATGMLIGLGGPFWFDAVKRLTSVTQVARSILPGQSDQKQVSPTVLKETLKKPSEAFMSAFKANQLLTSTASGEQQSSVPKAFRV